MNVNPGILFALAAIFAPLVTSEDKVTVSVYYETHCPDSKAFLLDQLIPTYRELTEITNVQLFPYGKASYERLDNGTYQFYCQHGPRECRGNTVQACALDMYPIDKVIPFVECMEKSGLPDTVVDSCAQSSDLDASKVNQCADGAKGNNLLLQMGQATKAANPHLRFVPSIHINGVYNDDIQRDALSNLKRVICSTYKGDNAKCK